jgi:hypothetical protein
MLNDPIDAHAMNRVFVRCGMVPAPVETIWDNHLHAAAVTYLLVVRCLSNFWQSATSSPSPPVPP